MKKIKMMGICLSVLVVAGTVVALTSNVFAASKANSADNTIPNQVYIGEVSVGGMTADEAKDAVNAYIADNTDVDVTLEAGANSITVKASELGLQWGNTQVAEEAVNIGKSGNLIKRYKDKKDLENDTKVYDIVYSVDTAKAQSVLEENADKLNQEAQNASLTRENGSFSFEEGKEGIEVNVADSIQNIIDYFSNDWTGDNADITLTADVVEPEGNQESLSKVKDVLGSYNTDFSDSSAARIANITNAVSKIDGTVLYPGEEFSVYEAIAPLDADNGYELAGAYENGVTVESYGGGVCQVSTTLYNAVLHAELNVTQRSNHSMLVTYVKPGQDAAIAGTYKDLKFENSTDAPIYLEGYVSGKVLYFNVYGEETRDSGRVVTFESETISQDEPITQIAASADPLGTVSVTQKAHIGQTAKLWKIVTVNGVEESREVVNTSKYSSSPKIITVGTATDNAEAAAAINAAIATQDEATVRLTAGQYAGDAAAVAAAQAELDARAAAAAAAQASVVPEDAAAQTDAQ